MTPASQASDKIRVGFDARWYNDSGVGAYVKGLLGAMVQIADEIELIVYEHPYNTVPLPSGSSVSRIAVKAKKYTVTEQFALARRCLEDRLDVFHSPFYVVPAFAACPVVVTVHDLIPFLFPIYSKSRQTIVRGGYRMAARKAAHIIADSSNTARDLERILRVRSENISPVHLGAGAVYSSNASAGECDVLRRKYGIQQPYVLLASARNWRTKNLATALRVLKTLRDAGLHFEVIAYGPRDGIESCQGNECSLEVKSTGYVAEEELAMLYRNARLFLCPSLYEGFGLPVLEAMSCGCPVVTSNAGALAEVAGAGAQVLDPYDVKGIVDAVGELLGNDARREHWRQAALRRSGDFSWTKAAQETVRVYHQTHKSSRRNRVAHKS